MDKRRSRRLSGQNEYSFLPRLLLLAVFFLCGVLMGQFLAGCVPDSSGEELRRYLTDYLALEGTQPLSARAVFSAMVICFRYPALAFLLGFASVGLVLLPVSAIAFGLFLSFSVSCFTAAFGEEGVLLALAVFGIRCAVTLPCFFLLAVPSLGTSAALASLSFGRGRRAAPVTYGRACWIRFAVCIAVGLAGVCAELFLSPVFLRLMLQRIIS